MESHEETVVRTTYATVRFLCSMGPVTKLADPNRQPASTRVSEAALDEEIAQASPVFQLSDFRAGSIASIASKPWSEFETEESAKVPNLTASTETRSFTMEQYTQSWTGITVQWARSPVSDSPEAAALVAQGMARPVADQVAIAASFSGITNEPVVFTRYAAFTVTTTFQGQSVGPYKAIFLFGKLKSGAEIRVSVDPFASQAVGLALSLQAYPAGLLRTNLRDLPSISAWVAANRIKDTRCSTINPGLCCVNDHCGLAEASVSRDLAMPVPDPLPRIEVDARRSATSE